MKMNPIGRGQYRMNKQQITCRQVDRRLILDEDYVKKERILIARLHST